MKRLIHCAATFILSTGLLAISDAGAQTGSPTAPAPGGPNVAGISGPAGTTQPAGRPGTTQAAGRPGLTQPAGGAGTTFGTANTAVTRRDAAAAQIGQGFDAGFSRPSAGDRFSTPGRFGDSPGVFVPDQSSGSIRNPISALPGRPNFSGGSTSATFRPAAPIAGGANPGNQVFRPNELFDSPLGDITPFNGPAARGIGAALSVPRIAVPPAVVVPGAAAPGGSVSPASPQIYVAPIPVPVGGASTAESETEVETISATPIPAQLQPNRVATATAFPDRNRLVRQDQDVVETASTRSTLPTARADYVEITTGRSERRTVGYRGDRSTSAQPEGLAYVYPGYTLWQGYYWYHNPNSGWHYWNGDRWTRF